jgi:hypothetical protein
MADEQFDNNGDDWQQLQNDWQSYQPDIAKIKRRIAWVSWRMVAVLALDVLVVVTYIPFLIFWVFEDGVSLAEKIWHFGMLPLLLYGVYWDFKLRLPLFKLDSESTRGILECYLKRVSAGVSLGNLGYKFSLLLLGLFLLWVGSSFYFELGEEKLQQPVFITFGVLWIGFFAVILFWYRNKKQKELNKLTELWKEFLE